MTNNEIVTLAKVGYVVVATEGQSQQNLQKLSDIFLNVIPNITQEHAQQADRMSMKKMVDNLKRFPESHYEASLILSSLDKNFYSHKANLITRELQEILRTKQFSKTRMPELAIRIQMDNHLF